MDLKTFGQLIQTRRQRLAMTAHEAYRKAGVTNKTWKRLEDGEPVRTATILSLDTVFDEPPGTMERMLAGDEDALRRHWDLPVPEPLPPPSPPVPVEIDTFDPMQPDIELEVGSQQYTESLRFLLRHTTASLRLLSQPVYQVLRVREQREKEAKLKDIQNELSDVTEALASTTDDRAANYLRGRVTALTREIRNLNNTEDQAAAIVSLVGDRRINRQG